MWTCVIVMKQLKAACGEGIEMYCVQGGNAIAGHIGLRWDL